MSKLNLEYANSLKLLIRQSGNINLLLVGCGGTGSWLAPSVARIARLMRDRYSTKVTIAFMDPDLVEEKNIYRQNFCSAEIGMNKAAALAERYGLAWGIEIFAVGTAIEEDKAGLNPNGGTSILIGCVDNAKARRAIKSQGHSWWLDCGNSQNSGQVLLGCSYYFDKSIFDLEGYCGWLPSPDLQHPELIEKTEVELKVEEENISCAEMALRDSQGLAINQRMAAEAADYLVRMLITKDLRKFATYIDLESGTVKSKYITAKTIKSYANR